jgi:hypothetical protein
MRRKGLSGIRFRRTDVLLVTALVSCLATSAAAQVPAGAVFFDSASDTIVAAGHTVLGTTATFEARVFLPTGVGAGGRVYNEWTNFQEDKLLFVDPTGIRGYTHPIAGTLLVASTPLTADTWHHIAFVADGPSNEQRLYLDGVKVATQAGSGDIGDGGGDDFGHPFLGAIFRDGSRQDSFIGYLDTFRVSDHARYSGNNFAAPTGDLSDDANTLILFNFSADDITIGQGAVTVADLSGNMHTGTFGTGFPDATSPRLPGTIDVDDTNSITPLTDGLLLLRYFFGFTGTTLTGGAVGGGCGRCDAASIHPYISSLLGALDVDADGSVAPLTDGLLILRSLFGFTGATLTAGALGNDCDRCDAADIAAYIQGLQ